MSLTGMYEGGYYDDTGHWVKTKHCFIYCGQRCTCQPPLGQHYSAAHDKRPVDDPARPRPNAPQVSREWLMRMAKLEDECGWSGCPTCGALAGCCSKYPDCPGGKPADKEPQ